MIRDRHHRPCYRYSISLLKRAEPRPFIYQAVKYIWNTLSVSNMSQEDGMDNGCTASKTLTRRGTLRNLGAGFIILTGGTKGTLASDGTVQADSADKLMNNYDDWKKGYNNLVEKYGRSEANTVAYISKTELEKHDRSGININQAFENTIKRILNHSETSQISNEIEQYREWIQEQRSRRVESTDKIKKIDEDVTYDNIIYNRTLANTDEESSHWGIAATNTSVQRESAWNDGRARGFTDSVPTGGGSFAVRLETHSLTFDSNQIQVDADYHVRGNNMSVSPVALSKTGPVVPEVGGSDASVFLYIREQGDDNMVTEWIEDLGYTNSQRNNKSAQFLVDTSTSYQVGIEITGSVTSYVDAAFSDYYYTHHGPFYQRRLKVDNDDDDFVITELH